METLKIENLKINNQGRNFHSEFYTRLNDTISRINLLMEKKGFIPESRKNALSVIEYAMENEVTIEQIDGALVFCDNDMEKAMNILKNNRI